jgi:hypothetical protein
MAAALKFVAQGPMDVLAFRVVSVTGDSSYPTGGYPFSLAECDMKRIISVEPVAQAGHIVEWNRTTGKLLFYKNQATANSNPLVEVTAATNMTTIVVEVLVLGEYR